MDKFAKYALITLVVINLALLAFAYISFIVGGNSATDDNVNDKASGREGDIYYNPFTVEPWGTNGEYVGFSLAGALGGFIAGFCIPTVFENDEFLAPKRREPV